MQELVSMVRGLLSKGEKGSFVDNLPLPIEIESAIPAGPDGWLSSPEDDEITYALASNNLRVVVVGNSNLKMISEELLSISSTCSTFLLIQMKFPGLLTASR